ncbi:Class II abasic (AP) endonuclease [Trapelia coarctata]|nr:Class II abasic (AP) endonuclease [Trapelia coarctata]
MGLRITTWNVNGIRNPFSYQPWRDKRTFAAMFDILEADIVVFQETKIQRKDLLDDMVLVPGWDCYFSLPKHKKGYSGVVIYTRQSVCCPIRAEEGITGVLCPPHSTSSFSDLPQDQQIGGYPTAAQASAVLDTSNLATDFQTLDSEGRCVILEFPAFVLIGVYSPANRDETRDDFRIGFLSLLDTRVRNLVAMGKRVFLTGDLNISKEELDTANAESAMRKSGMTAIEYFSTPARRLFNHLLEDGKVYGDRDEGREKPVLLDICRSFHPARKGMFTCWEQKTNARPGNFGSRIDYVLCSLDMRDWFSDSNIQEGLMGSDHCPVYATMKERIQVGDTDTHVLDFMNPPGIFANGRRLREYSVKDTLPLSGKMIPEFDRRQSIREMFKRKPMLPTLQSGVPSIAQEPPPNATIPSDAQPRSAATPAADSHSFSAKVSSVQPSTPKNLASMGGGIANTTSLKRAASDATNMSLKRGKSEATSSKPSAMSQGKGQQSLKGFFKPNTAGASSQAGIPRSNGTASSESAPLQESGRKILDGAKTAEDVSRGLVSAASTSFGGDEQFDSTASITSATHSPARVRGGNQRQHGEDVHDPIESKESWSKLFTKPATPRCEGHSEPCVSLLTKKSGMNCGRSFWMCPRPLGPSGMKEKGTQWRCQTFIWCSDWSAKDA